VRIVLPKKILAIHKLRQHIFGPFLTHTHPCYCGVTSQKDAMAWNSIPNFTGWFMGNFSSKRNCTMLYVTALVQCTCVPQYRDFNCGVFVFGFEKILEMEIFWICFAVSARELNHLSSESYILVYNRNQVSVSGTETKVQFWYQYRSRNFFQTNSNFLMFYSLLGGYKFLKAWNWTQIFKNNLKILMMKKIPHTIVNQIFSLKCGIGYSIGRFLGFSFGIRPKPKHKVPKKWFRPYTATDLTTYCQDPVV
jgi:hypothetical protein